MRNHGAASIILGSLALIGLAMTAVSAAKDGPKAAEALEEAKEAKGEELTTTEKVKTVAPIFAKTAVIGAATAGAIVLSHKGLVSKNTLTVGGAATAAGVWKKKYQELSKKSEQILGKEKVAEIKKELRLDKDKDTKTQKKKKQLLMCMSDNKFLIYEPFTNQFIYTSQEKLLSGDLYLKQSLRNRGHASLNEYAKRIGGKAKMEYDNWGWDINNKYLNEAWSIIGDPVVEPYLSVDEVDGKDVLSMWYHMEPFDLREEDRIDYEI